MPADITNYSWPTFRDRITRIWGDLAYVTLSDRTVRGSEERLGQWPSVKGELPAGEIVDQIRDLWTWLGSAMEDAAEGHGAGGVLHFRLRAYAVKGMEVVDQFTFRVEPPEQEEDNEPDDLEDYQDTPPEHPLNQGEQGVAIALRAVAQTHRWQQSAMNRLLLGFRQQQEASQAQIEQLGRSVAATREDMLALVDLLVADRLETSEIALKEARGGRKRPSKEPSPIAKEALGVLGDLGKTWLGGGGFPPALATLAKTLSKHPRGKELLEDPRLQTLLTKPDEIEALVSMLEGVLESIPAGDAGTDAAGTGAAGTGDNTDPYEYDE